MSRRASDGGVWGKWENRWLWAGLPTDEAASTRGTRKKAATRFSTCSFFLISHFVTSYQVHPRLEWVSSLLTVLLLKGDSGEGFRGFLRFWISRTSVPGWTSWLEKKNKKREETKSFSIPRSTEWQPGGMVDVAKKILVTVTSGRKTNAAVTNRAGYSFLVPLSASLFA